MPEMCSDAPVVIVGGGLAGLSCARTLHQAHVPFVLLEASARVGGRVATDEVDGFLLDRGFQVLLDAYPEARQVFDYEALQLRPFFPGALVQLGGRRHRFADPWRRPLTSLAGLAAPIFGLADAWRIAQLRRAARRDPDPTGTGPSTAEYLQQRGLSERVIERFFRPFFGGVFLDRDLLTSSAFFRFVFSMFSEGSATLPAHGMKALPEQLAANLPAGSVRLNAPVAGVEQRVVRLANRETIAAEAVVVATDADTAGRLLGTGRTITWNATTTLYFAAPQSPLGEGILVLNGNGHGRVNHVCVPSDLSRNYAPDGQALISVSVIGIATEDDESLERAIQSELRAWFGQLVNGWRLLRIYRIAQALPRTEPRRAAETSPQNGVLTCGDYLQDPSINGALRSGRQAAEAILAGRGGAAAST